MGNKTACGICLTNAFSLPSPLQFGLFLIGSLFNHSCDPNVHWAWCQHRGHAVFRTIQDVESGTELSICYDKRILFDPTEVRRAETQRNWKLRCCCASCSLVGGARAASDARRLDTAVRLVEAMRSRASRAESESN